MSLTTELMSVHDVAIMLNVHRSRVNVLLQQGRLDGAVKVGRDWVMPRESVENFKRLPPGGRKNLKQQHEEDKALIAAVREELKGAVKNGECR